MTNKEIAALNEEKFQKAYDIWEQSGYLDKESYQQMFNCVLFASENLIKKRLRSTKGKLEEDEINGLACELCCLLFERDIKGAHKRPEKLSSYLFLPMLGIMYDHQKQFEEKASSIICEMTKDEDLEEDIELLKEEEKLYTKTYTEIVKDEKTGEEKEVTRIGEIFTSQQLRNPDFVMSHLFGWDYN